MESADDLFEIEKMARAAQLYLLQGTPQQNIAAELGISQSKVSRMLAKARKIFTIHIEMPQYLRLQENLKKCFDEELGINFVIVPTGVDSLIASNLGVMAARYLENMLDEWPERQITIGVACGRTIQSVVRSLRVEHITDLDRISVYPLSIADDYRIIDHYPNSLVHELTAKFFSHPASLEVEAFNLQMFISDHELQILRDTSRSESERDKLRREILDRYNLADIFQQMQNADLFLLGIGNATFQSPNFARVLERHPIDDRVRRIAVGEINFQVFGEPHKSREAMPFPYDLFAVPLSALQRGCETGKRVIAVAGGIEKGKPIINALRWAREVGKTFFNVLITTYENAAEIYREFG